MKVIFSTALINRNFERRKQEYVESYNKLCEYVNKEDIIIIEGYLQKSRTFLDDLNNNVHYSEFSTNYTDNLNNKGVKEFNSYKDFLLNTELDNNTKMFKITGRYLLLSSDFLNFCRNEENDYDAFVCRVPNGQIFTGCFCMKLKYLKDLIFNYVDYDDIEEKMECVERIVGNYLINRNLKIFYKNYPEDRINIKCLIGESTYFSYY